MKLYFDIVPTIGSTDTSRNLKVSLDIQGSLPFVSNVQHLIGTDAEGTDSATITYDNNVNTSRLGELDDGEVKNALFDKENPDRFTYFGYLASTGRGTGHLVHDDIHKLIYLIPNLRTFGDVGLQGRDINVHIWVVGGDCSDVMYTSTSGDAFVKEKCHIIPKPTKKANVSVHSFLTTENDTANNNNYGISLNKGYLESDVMGLIDFGGLGDSDSLFGVKVPVYQRIEYGFKRYAYIYNGVQNVNDLLVPLPF